MIFNKKNLFISTSILSAAPIAFVVSCSSSLDSTEPVIKQTEDLKNFLNTNTNALSPKGTNVVIKNFVDITSWKNLDDLITKLSDYVNIDESFRTEISKDGNSIYKEIKRVVIQPKEGSKDLSIIFYLRRSNTDKNLVSNVVTNALQSNFSYENKLTVSLPDSQTFIDKTKFNDLWKKAIDNKDDASLDELLTLIFNNPSQEIKTKIKSNRDNFKFDKNSYYQIIIRIVQKGINEGFIFETTKGLDNIVISNSLVETN